MASSGQEASSTFWGKLFYLSSLQEESSKTQDVSTVLLHLPPRFYSLEVSQQNDNATSEEGTREVLESTANSVRPYLVCFDSHHRRCSHLRRII